MHSNMSPAPTSLSFAFCTALSPPLFRKDGLVSSYTKSHSINDGEKCCYSVSCNQYIRKPCHPRRCGVSTSCRVSSVSQPNLMFCDSNSRCFSTYVLSDNNSRGAIQRRNLNQRHNVAEFHFRTPLESPVANVVSGQKLCSGSSRTLEASKSRSWATPNSANEMANEAENEDRADYGVEGDAVSKLGSLNVKENLKVGSPIVITEAPPLLKTAEPMPMMRPNTGLIKAGDAGRVIDRRPKDVWAVRFAVGAYLIDRKYFEPLELT